MTTITQLKEVKEISDEQLLALDTLEETLSLPLGSLKTFMEEYLNGKYARLAAENTFTQNNTMKGVLYFQNGNNTPAGINQGTSGQLYISATGGIDMTSPTSVTVPVPDNNDRSQKAAPTEWVLTQMGRLGGLPTGSIVAWSGSTAPDGWLLCNGGAVSRTTYPQLFAAIGTSFGSGDGKSTFNLPQNYSKNVMGAPDWYITATNYDKGKVNEIQDNGYLILKGGALNNNQYMITFCEKSIFVTDSYSNSYINGDMCVFPVSKGDTATVNSSYGGAMNQWYPAKPVNTFNLIIKY